MGISLDSLRKRSLIMLKFAGTITSVCICLLFALSAQAGVTPGWTQQTSHTRAKLGGVSFIDTNIGYISGDSGVVLKTRDGGANWTRLSTGTTTGFMDIHAADSIHVYVTVGNGGGVMKTENGGATWSTIAPSKDSMTASGIWFMNSQKGFFSVGKYITGSSNILRTRNGGTSWDTVLSSTQWISYLQFPDPGHGYATGSSGTIFKTVDSGATWTSLVVDSSLFMSGVYFLSKDTGYSGGAAGPMVNNTYSNKRVFRTVDGGLHWSIVSNAVAGVKLFFCNDSVGYLVGGDSMIINISPASNFKVMRTQDRGATWTVVGAPGINLYGVYFPSSNIGYFVGDSGAIFKYLGPSAVKYSPGSFVSARIGIDKVTVVGNRLRIGYSLVSEVTRQVEFALYDIRGNRIWSKTVGGGHAAGSNTVVFPLPRGWAAGTYLFVMSTTNAISGKLTSTRQIILQH